QDPPVGQECKRPRYFQAASNHLHRELLELGIEYLVLKTGDRPPRLRFAEVSNRCDEPRERCDLNVAQRVAEGRHAVLGDAILDHTFNLGLTLCALQTAAR